ncbi:MAG: hypothetical protein WBX25_21485 [Rhodomicrobium sp.]
MNVALTSPFAAALLAEAPATDHTEKLQLYAWLVGSWEMDVMIHKADGAKQSLHGTVNAAWILDGRAIQDVFAVPGLFHGTSLRFYDPHIDAWQVFWIDPL